mgnify:CR=1 FL=1
MLLKRGREVGNRRITEQHRHFCYAQSFFIQKIFRVFHPLALIKVEHSGTKQFFETFFQVTFIDGYFTAEFFNGDRFADMLYQYFSCLDDLFTIGFVGKEWQRKGLPLAVAVVKQLRRTRPDLQFVVIGPAAGDVQHLFADWQGGYVLKGWSDKAHYAEFDVLLHPAKAEPYGMVISEAMAARVPVVISSACGAAVHVSSAAGRVLAPDAAIGHWVEALERQLSRTGLVPQFEHGWREAAQEYERFYCDFIAGRNRRQIVCGDRAMCLPKNTRAA